jgi:hypothetical protein
MDDFEMPSLGQFAQLMKSPITIPAMIAGPNASRSGAIPRKKAHFQDRLR